MIRSGIAVAAGIAAVVTLAASPLWITLPILILMIALGMAKAR